MATHFFQGSGSQVQLPVLQLAQVMRPVQSEYQPSDLEPILSHFEVHPIHLPSLIMLLEHESTQPSWPAAS